MVASCTRTWIDESGANAVFRVEPPLPSDAVKAKINGLIQDTLFSLCCALGGLFITHLLTYCKYRTPTWPDSTCSLSSSRHLQSRRSFDRPSVLAASYDSLPVAHQSVDPPVSQAASLRDVRSSTVQHVPHAVDAVSAPTDVNVSYRVPLCASQPRPPRRVQRIVVHNTVLGRVETLP